MTAHRNGQWCKKINGDIRYFGKIDDHQAALRKFNFELPFWSSGQEPPRITTTTTTGNPVDLGPTLDEVGNRFLARELKRYDRGDIGLESYLDTRRAIIAMFDYSGRERRLLAMRPDDWADLRHHLETEPDPTRPNERRRGVYAFDRTITYIRGMRKWAEANLLQPGQVVRWGDSFNRVKRSEKRKTRRARSKLHGDRIFTREQVHLILDAAPSVLKAMFLLAINGGFGAADLSAMPIDVIDLDKAIIEYDRVKTGVGRTVTLWPRTVQALREAIPLRPDPKPGFEHHAFLTRCGVPFCRDKKVVDNDGNPIKSTRANAIAGEFGKVLKGLKLKRYGLNFYAESSTFHTHSGGPRDSETPKHIMGHALDGEAEWYAKPQIERLRAVTAHVERVLFG